MLLEWLVLGWTVRVQAAAQSLPLPPSLHGDNGLLAGMA